jgi:hypothetical protein
MFNVRSVYIVACAAVPSFFLIYVKCMKIFLPVPERCYSSGFFDCDKGFLMTEEAEAVFPFRVRGIKLVRESQSEYKGIIRPMRTMTGCAVTLSYRSMLKAPIFPYAFILMAFIAESVNFIDQKILPV